MSVTLYTTIENTPRYGSDGAAGFDLCSTMSATIEPQTCQWIGTNLKVDIPSGYFGLVHNRSSISAKMVNVGAGIVDSDYRGEVKVCLQNHGRENFVVSVGDRIAQMIIIPFMRATFVQVGELSQTVRGTSGFGSTGLSSFANDVGELTNSPSDFTNSPSEFINSPSMFINSPLQFTNIPFPNMQMFQFMHHGMPRRDTPNVQIADDDESELSSDISKLSSDVSELNSGMGNLGVADPGDHFELLD